MSIDTIYIETDALKTDFYTIARKHPKHKTISIINADAYEHGCAYRGGW